MWDDLERNLISLGAMDESGCIYKAQGGVLDVMKGFLVVVKGLFYVLQENIVNGEAAMFENKEEQVVLNSLQENNQKNDQKGGAGNLQEEDADDEAEVRGSLDCPKCHKQEKFEVFGEQISKST
ncbi:Hypothetical predicted protein [Olea europaea subsp. europaea]|nr:Hypothetical predicted protein [Olea europaea subsp. europaea]